MKALESCCNFRPLVSLNNSTDSDFFQVMTVDLFSEMQITVSLLKNLSPFGSGMFCSPIERLVVTVQLRIKSNISLFFFKFKNYLSWIFMGGLISTKGVSYPTGNFRPWKKKNGANNSMEQRRDQTTAAANIWFREQRKEGERLMRTNASTAIHLVTKNTRQVITVAWWNVCNHLEHTCRLFVIQLHLFNQKIPKNR